jgi:hypothetical protein
MSWKWALLIGFACCFPLRGWAQERADKAPAEKEYVPDYMRVEARGTLTSAEGVIRIEVRPGVFGGSQAWKLVLETPEALKTAKGLMGKPVTLKGELRFIDGGIGTDGKALPPDNRPFHPARGELGIVVSELKAVEPPKDK